LALPFPLKRQGIRAGIWNQGKGTPGGIFLLYFFPGIPILARGKGKEGLKAPQREGLGN